MGNSLVSLTMRLNAEGLNYKKASDFQGVLFQFIDQEYGDYLHQQQLHPYSQYIFFEDKIPYWRINTTDDEAYRNVIVPMLDDDIKSFEIHNGNINVVIEDKTVEKRDYESLLKEFYNKKTYKQVKVEFITLTAFKQRGRYNITPNLRLIFQSLMMKYSAISGNDNMIDEDALDELALNSQIISYNLFSSRFPMEGNSVPGFVGKMTIRLFGTDTMARYARMLLEFGEYSGVGIKTGMGMGGIRIIREGESQ